MEHKQNHTINGKDYTFETGKWARQAGGSVLLRWGNMVIMANTTAAPTAREGMDFFPLTVEYREKFYASGKIPGGFFKREARPSEKETLTSRLTDRPIRPLFPKNFKNETQLFVTLLSLDQAYPGNVHSITVSSAALMVSDLPFFGPVAGVQVGRINGDFILFPTHEQLAESDINLLLAGSMDAVTMIEGSADEVAEEDMIAAVEFGHDHIKELCKVQIAFKEKAGKETREVIEPEDFSAIKSEMEAICKADLAKANAVKGKHERDEAISKVEEDLLEKLEATWAEKLETPEELSSQLSIAKNLFHDIEVDIVRDQIFNDGIRSDGRKLNEIRDITVDAGVLPATHGSALFTRGETQSLGVVTLSTGTDAQIIDDVEGDSKRHFYLHYNFPPFSVGEVRRFIGPGRREIGHGKLAENALRAVIPKNDDFPYVVRIVSEILESNGSSSMATICSGSIAMMDAGLPIKSAVAGIAMGLITEGDKFAVLSDIAGLEDHMGDMDFKVAGTEKGITAFQLDLKVTGISTEIMAKALSQAKEGRIHILGKMNEVLKSPRTDLAETAPKMKSVQIEKEKIGEFIGPGGKNIKMVTEKSGAEIFIDDDGLISIASTDIAAVEKACDMIEMQFKEAEVNAIYEGEVKRVTDFGAFVEVLPGKDGLVHISKLSKDRVEKVTDVVKEGEIVKVKVLSVDKMGKISLTMVDVE